MASPPWTDYQCSIAPQPGECRCLSKRMVLERSHATYVSVGGIRALLVAQQSIKSFDPDLGDRHLSHYFGSLAVIVRVDVGGMSDRCFVSEETMLTAKRPRRRKAWLVAERSLPTALAPRDDDYAERAGQGRAFVVAAGQYGRVPIFYGQERRALWTRRRRSVRIGGPREGKRC